MRSPVFADIHTKPLMLAPEFFVQVAAWHHQECERQGLKSSLELRQQRLQLHVQAHSLPQTLVAIEHGSPIGCVSLVNYSFRSDNSALIPRNAPHAAPPLWLSNLFVREDQRERGVGTLLIDVAVNYAKAMGINELWLSAAEFTGFYQKREWEIVRRTRLGGRPVNIMKRALI